MCEPTRQHLMSTAYAARKAALFPAITKRPHMITIFSLH
jgi:hypothetical protein